MCMMILIEDLDDYHNDKMSAEKTSHRVITMQPSNRINNTGSKMKDNILYYQYIKDTTV